MATGLRRPRQGALGTGAFSGGARVYTLIQLRAPVAVYRAASAQAAAAGQSMNAFLVHLLAQALGVDAVVPVSEEP